jgi:hypothetical protein
MTTALQRVPSAEHGCAAPAGIADYLQAPRCDARTRVGCPCRQPAMANGRCRMHGGLSTGPRTPEGLARSRAARLTIACGHRRLSPREICLDAGQSKFL